MQGNAVPASYRVCSTALCRRGKYKLAILDGEPTPAEYQYGKRKQHRMTTHPFLRSTPALRLSRRHTSLPSIRMHTYIHTVYPPDGTMVYSTYVCVDGAGEKLPKDICTYILRMYIHMFATRRMCSRGYRTWCLLRIDSAQSTEYV